VTLVSRDTRSVEICRRRIDVRASMSTVSCTVRHVAAQWTPGGPPCPASLSSVTSASTHHHRQHSSLHGPHACRDHVFLGISVCLSVGACLQQSPISDRPVSTPTAATEIHTRSFASSIIRSCSVHARPSHTVVALCLGPRCDRCIYYRGRSRRSLRDDWQPAGVREPRLCFIGHHILTTNTAGRRKPIEPGDLPTDRHIKDVASRCHMSQSAVFVLGRRRSNEVVTTSSTESRSSVSSRWRAD